MAGHTRRLGIGLVTVVALLATDGVSSRAQERPTAPSDTVHLTLATALQRALDHNSGLRAVAEEAHAADRAAAAAFRERFGEVDAVAAMSRYQDAQILRPISRELLAGGFDNLPFARSQIHYGLTFELPLFVGGRLLAGSHMARLEADEADALLEGTRWQVRANVTTLYAAAQALAAATRAYGDEVASLEQTDARVQLMVREGKRPQVDLLKATGAVEEARARLADAEADRERVRAFLLALLDYPADQAFTLDSLPDRFPALPPDSADWNALIQQAAPVATAALRVRQAGSGKDMARAEFLPRVSVRGRLVGNAGSGVPGSLETWELTLAASIPVFTAGRRVAAYQRAAAAERAADLQLRQTLLQQQAELRGALARFRAAGEQLEAARRQVAATDEAARIEIVRYENGAGTIEDLLSARTRASAGEAFLAKTKGDVLGAAARVNALVEREIIR